MMRFFRILILLFILLFIFLSSVVSLQAQKKGELRALGLYGYNMTWQHYGALDLWAKIPNNRYFECETAVELNTANIYSFSIDARPMYPLSVGSLYLDIRLLYRAVVRNSIHDVEGSLAVGYKMDYVDVRMGACNRMMINFKRNWHSEEEILTEPIDLLYSLEVFARPQSSCWNLSMKIANTDDFQIERMWQPLFMLGGSYSPTDRLTVLLQAQCKPTGMFHLDASFYGAGVRAGVSYKL